jgi:hypothetical protein
VGNYPHGDMLAMIGKLSETVGLSSRDLVYTFGRYLFKTFAREYNVFFKDMDSSIEFLHGIETVIHSEVRKLYPDANLPSFDCWIDEDGTLFMDYQSHRPMADLAEGLITECMDYFGDGMQMTRESGPTNDTFSARFILKKVV